LIIACLILNPPELSSKNRHIYTSIPTDNQGISDKIIDIQESEMYTISMENEEINDQSFEGEKL
jgi:hypothetical protein